MASGILLLGCTGSRSGTVLRTAEDIPPRFYPAEGVELDDRSCKSPMIDTRDGTKIIMVSSTDNHGAYRVPEGRYGVRKGELLRLDCRTGEVIGIVKD